MYKINNVKMSDIDKRVVQFKDRARNDTPVYPYTRHYSVIDENNKELDDYLYEYNVNSLDPSAGPTTIYTLSGAIARVPNAYRNKRGLTLSFLSSSDLVESHIWVCGTDITDMGNDISSAEVPPLKKNWIDIIRTLNYARVSPITTGSSINSVKLARVTGSVAGAYGSISLGENCNAAATRSFACGNRTKAFGASSHAEGEDSKTNTTAAASHVEGFDCETGGNYTTNTKADYSSSIKGEMSHAEGNRTIANGNAAHSEGKKTLASGANSHAEGKTTTASGNNSHAEGFNTTASGDYSHAEGAKYKSNINTTAAGDASHAEGASTQTKGHASHSEGLLTTAGRTQAEAVAAVSNFPNLSGTTEQKVTKLIGFASHAEGSTTQALGTSSHAEGNSTQALVNATHAEGDTTTASGEAAHSEGYNTTASGNQSHSEGYNTQATANQAHSEGKKTIASAENAHSEGNETKAVGNASHSEGYKTYAYGAMSHIEGTSSTLVSDANAASASVESIWEQNGHNFSLSRGQGSHVEGKNCLATGDWSHAEGSYTAASGEASHVEGRGTIAQNLAEHAEGKYNRSIPNKSIHTVGIGDVSSRKNAHVITSDGLHYILGVGGVNGFESSASDLSNRTDLATYLNSIVGGTGPRRIVTSLNAYRSGNIPITLNLDLYNGRFGLDCNTAHIYDHDGQNIIYTLYTNMMNSLGQSIKQQSDLDGIYNDIVNYFSNATFDLFTTSEISPGTITHNLYQCKEYVVDNVNEEAHFTFAREDDTQNLYYLYIYYGGPGGTGIRLEFEPF